MAGSRSGTDSSFLPRFRSAFPIFLLPWCHQIVKNVSSAKPLVLRRELPINLKYHRFVLWATNLLNPIPRKPVKSRPRRPRLWRPSPQQRLPNRLLRKRSSRGWHGAAALSGPILLSESVGICFNLRTQFSRRKKVVRRCVLVFDLDTLKSAGEFPNTGGRGVAVDPASHHGFSSSSPISMFDTRTLEVVKKIEVQGGPDGQRRGGGRGGPSFLDILVVGK